MAVATTSPKTQWFWNNNYFIHHFGNNNNNNNNLEVTPSLGIALFSD